jgi:branched-chain amino acid aminotransferase
VSIESVWVNGRCASLGELSLSPHDRGLTLADGLFETMRVDSGVVFRLDQHLARLNYGLSVLRIQAPPELGDWIRLACSEAPPGAASIRLTVTRGVGAGGVAVSPDARATVIVALNPMPAFPPAIYERGLSARVASGRRNSHSLTAGLKTIAYTDNIVGWLEAQDASADEALFLDTEGYCSEATASNLFAWIADELVTPSTSCAALPGITRAAVMELASSLGIATAECAFRLDDLLNADEAFLTSSLRGLAPLVRVDGRAIGDGQPGPNTRRFMVAYADLVARECGQVGERSGNV